MVISDEHELIEVFSALRRAIIQAKEQVITGLSFSRTQLEILALIYKSGGVSGGELARQLHLTPGAVSQTVDTLVKRGYVMRHHDQIDKRLIRHEVTASGRTVITRLQAARRQRIRRFMAEVPPDELATTIQVMKHLTAFIESDISSNQHVKEQ